MTEAMRFYFLTNKLKYVVRTGWKYWNVPYDRLESIAEHVYGTCMLVIGIDSEYDLGIDINHIIKMLVCHEMEELVIGDNTPYDNITEGEKLEQGRKAVTWILGNLVKREEYMKLLDEFNAKKTKEAKIAFYCDKLECDLQAKIYSDALNIEIEKANEKLLSNSRIHEIRQSGFNTVGDIFIEFDRYRYEDNKVFLALLSELQNTDTSFVLKKKNSNVQKTYN